MKKLTSDQRKAAFKRFIWSFVWLVIVDIAVFIVYSFFFAGAAADEQYLTQARIQNIIVSLAGSVMAVIFIINVYANDGDEKYRIINELKEKNYRDFDFRGYYLHLLKTQGFIYPIIIAVCQLPLTVMYAASLKAGLVLTASTLGRYAQYFSLYMLFYEITDNAFFGWLLNTVFYSLGIFAGIYFVLKKYCVIPTHIAKEISEERKQI